MNKHTKQELDNRVSSSMLKNKDDWWLYEVKVDSKTVWTTTARTPLGCSMRMHEAMPKIRATVLKHLS